VQRALVSGRTIPALVRRTAATTTTSSIKYAERFTFKTLLTKKTFATFTVRDTMSTGVHVYT